MRDATALTVTISNRLPSVKRHHGLGAGLYLCNRLAEQLGGTLTAEAEDGVYRVCIRLPRA